MRVMIGIDPHKGSHTAVAVDLDEHVLGELRVRSGPKQLERLLKWAERFAERTWAVENATALGYLLAQQLVAAGERVLDVQPKLAARVRLLATESTNKNDPHDARSVAIAALRSRAPKEVGVEDHAAVMKLWARRHRNLSSTRTQVACRLHAVLCDLVAGGVPDEIYAEKAASLLAEVEPDSAVAAARFELAEELLDDLRRVDNQIKESKKRLEQVVAASGTTVIDIFGVGPFVAATVVGITGDIARFPTRDRFAAFNGTAPVEVSSGGRKVWRLSRRGNRTLQPRHPHGRCHPGPVAPQSWPGVLRPQDRRGARHPRKRCAPSSDASATRSGLPGCRRSPRCSLRSERGSGRATGERLCRQRGRFTPRYTGSSAQPLPNPSQGYDHEPPPTTWDHPIHDEGVNNRLTNKEDSFCAIARPLRGARSASVDGPRVVAGSLGEAVSKGDDLVGQSCERDRVQPVGLSSSPFAAQPLDVFTCFGWLL